MATVRDALAAAGVTAAVRVLDGHARTAAQAAAFLGIEIAQIANSLVFRVTDAGGEETPLLVMTSGAHRVDTEKVAAALGVDGLGRADADFVRRHTGFAIGGVAPLGHPRPLRTLVDASLAEHDRIWAAAGHPRTVFPTTFTELVRITGGEVVQVA